jgi:acyl transferase domain-containing protein
MDTQKEQQYRAALKAAKASILALREEAARLEEPIAVIGMSCLFPGLYPRDADSPEFFFQLLLDGNDGVVDIPPERLEQWASKLPAEERPTVPGLRRAALLARDAYAFDSAFFGLTPAETRMTDPQHLLFLELAQSALWDASLPPGSEAGANTGVFCGKGGTDHLFDILGTGRLSADDPYTLTGNMHSAMAGRVSYFFDWTGPSVSCETACSTSLTATLQAVQSLRRGECDLALAGAVNLLLGPTPSHWLGAMRALAPDGRCKAFGAGADGFGRGEGGGVLVLRRLSDAQKHGSRIRALILGGAVGSDGRSRNFTSPSARGQRLVISRALKDAGIRPDEVAYVETHGTGTPLGDPIEAESLAAVYGRKENPPLIGSVKSNVAHLEAAAGMASLVKCIMAVQNGLIPKTLHADPLNPLLKPEQLGIRICRESQPWPSGYARRVAGLSAFAISGGLAHMIIAAPPEDSSPPLREAPAPLARLMPLAARSEELLSLQARECLARLEAGTPFAQLCAAAAGAGWLGNPLLPERLALCATEEEAPAALRAHLEGKRQRAVLRGALPKKAPSVIFLYSGQGSQSPGMGRRLYEMFPVFRETLDRCAALAAPRLGPSLLETLFSGTDEALNQTLFTQPAIYSHQAALTALLRSFGIAPSAVLGHSIGEYAAAYAAGVFSLEDGLDLTLRRGELAQALGAGSGMAAALGSEERVAELLRDHPAVSIAAVNSADSVTLAGERQALDLALAQLAADLVVQRMAELDGPALFQPGGYLDVVAGQRVVGQPVGDGQGFIFIE